MHRTVIGEAEDGTGAVKLARALRPDVVLMDVNMLGLNGIEATRQITAGNPEAAVLVISMLDDETVFSAMQAGARGYLLKGGAGERDVARHSGGGQRRGHFQPGRGPADDGLFHGWEAGDGRATLP